MRVSHWPSFSNTAEWSEDNSAPGWPACSLTGTRELSILSLPVSSWRALPCSGNAPRHTCSSLKAFRSGYPGSARCWHSEDYYGEDARSERLTFWGSLPSGPTSTEHLADQLL